MNVLKDQNFGILNAELDAQIGYVCVTGFSRLQHATPTLQIDTHTVAQAQTSLRVEVQDLKEGLPLRAGEHVKWRITYYGPVTTLSRLSVGFTLSPADEDGNTPPVHPVTADLILTLDRAQTFANPDITTQPVDAATWVTPPAPASVRFFSEMHPKAAAPKWYTAPRYVPEQNLVRVKDAIVSGYSAIYTRSGALLREGFRGYPYDHEFFHRLLQEARGHITPLHGNRVALHGAGPLQKIPGRCMFIGTRFLGASGYHIDLTSGESLHKEPFGHWIFEYLPRLWGLHQLQNEDVRLLIPQDAPDYALAQLNMLGFSSDEIVRYNPKHPAQCEELVVPSAPGCHSKFLSEQFATFLTLFWNRADSDTGLAKARKTLAQTPRHKRIYVARSDVPGRRPFAAEAALIDGLKDQGFHILAPGTVSEIEKIALFADAELVVGPMGSGLLNLAYARQTPKVVALVPDLMADRALSDIATYVPMELHYIFGQSQAETQAEGWAAPWSIDVAQTLMAITEIAGS